MPNMTYQYGQPGRGTRGGGNSRVRFYLLLIVISSLMAGVLGWFIVSQNRKDAGKKTPAAEVLPSDNSGKKTGEMETKPAPVPEQFPERTEKIKPVPPEISEKSVPVTPAAGDEKLPDSGKGELLPSDPPQELDRAQIPASQPVDESAKEILRSAQKLLKLRKYQAAVECAEKAVPLAQENSAFYRELWKTLSAARSNLIVEGAESAGIISRRIVSGDSLSRIAGRNATTIELLKKINHLSGSRLYVGRRLKILPGPWKIKIEKSARLLKLYRNGKLYLVFDAGIGRMGKTPSAEFAVSSRLYHPDWYTPEGRIYKYGDPENQLGSCFLKLALFSSPGKPLAGFGIHGCKDESTVGRSLSNGCVRLHNAEVELLYYLVPSGSRVEIAD